MKGRPVALVILDGWGLRAEREGNAIALAPTPTTLRLAAGCAHASLAAHGQAVGLTADQMGNSNVGHLNLGAGRVVYQDLPRIDLAIEDGSLFENPVLVKALQAPRVHLLGLTSDGGVHSHLRHLFALLTLAERLGTPTVFVHAFLDGRDTPPTSAPIYLGALAERLRKSPMATLATLAGRYYAMDRDNRWDRVELAYAALCREEGRWAPDWETALEVATAAGETDEFVRPTRLGGFDRIREGDQVLFWNFRADRARELSWALAGAEFSGFPRPEAPRPFTALTSYNAELPVPVAFPPVAVADGLGELVAQAGLKQLRLAETEKYAHVTYFFNGGREEPWPGEERLLIPSPAVATYDLQPEMSARAVTAAAVAAIRSGQYDFLVMNYANADMVGHTGSLPAAEAAVTAVDRSLGAVVTALEEVGGVGLVVADHGNAEQMISEDGKEPHTAHTLNRVPIYLVGRGCNDYTLRSGGLSDVAPTLLALLELPQPAAMTGHCLLSNKP